MVSVGDNGSSVGKALAILDCYRSNGAELGVSDLARRTQIPKSTVHRLAVRLCNAGYLIRTASNRFTLGMKVFELGAAAAADRSPAQDATRVLQHLSTLTGETSHLAILDGAEIVYLDKIETPHSADIPSRIGQRSPAHCTGVGKALLAWNWATCDLLPTRNGKLEAYTPTTVTDLAQLRHELTRINTTGVAYDNQERVPGLVCVAAPVRDRTGAAVAAIGLGGPTERMTPDNLPQLSHLVRAGAARLSTLNGWQPKARRTMSTYRQPMTLGGRER